MKVRILRVKAIRRLLSSLDKLPERPQLNKVEILCEDKVHKVIEFLAPQWALNKASEEAEKIHKEAEIRRKRGELGPEYVESTPWTRQTGMLGQMAISYYLFKNVEKGLEQIRYGEPDLYDIECKGYKIDVKTFSWMNKNREPDAWLYVPLYQFNKRHYPYYISCRRTKDNIIQLLGFINRQNLEECPIWDSKDCYYLKQLTKAVPDLTLLKSIQNILRLKQLNSAFD